jgi:glutamine synthetase
MQFLVFLTAVIRAVDLHADILRASIADAANDHRLGANEAPPAIVSVFLGAMLTDLLDQLEGGEATSTKKGGSLDLGARTLPRIPRHAGDRNRTSPFAFTGNKFEFRAVGSSQSIAWPNTVLNTIIAESLDFLATRLEQAVGNDRSPERIESSVNALLREVIKQHRRVVFDGDNYDAAWHREATERGLPNLETTVDALPALASAKTKDLFEKYGVLTHRELEARIDVLYERYNTVVGIEARTLAGMLRTMVLPAAHRAQTELAETIAATQAAGLECPHTEARLQPLIDLVAELGTALAEVEKAESASPAEVQSHARHVRDRLLPAMERARAASDALEQVVPDDLWPLPSYAQMLFLR